MAPTASVPRYKAIDAVLSCALVWTFAASGAGVMPVFLPRFEQLLLALYLGTRWTMFCLSRADAGNLTSFVLCFLFADGIACSCGAFVGYATPAPARRTIPGNDDARQ
jgi:predicted membrane channel-forming protein YqfA (hemolysin III family)